MYHVTTIQILKEKFLRNIVDRGQGQIQKFLSGGALTGGFGGYGIPRYEKFPKIG